MGPWGQVEVLESSETGMAQGRRCSMWDTKHAFLSVFTAVSSSKGAVLYEPCVVGTPMLRSEYCTGTTGVLRSSGSCSVVGTGELYIPCEPQGLLGCGSGRSSSMKMGAGSNSCSR